MKKAERKQKALELLKELRIHKPYINGFQKEDQVCFFEGHAGYWVFQEPAIEAKMKEIEQKHKCTVYAITHEFTEFGECYSFLIVTDYKEEWEYLLEEWQNGQFRAFAYVWNKDVEYNSEFGSVGLHSAYGGIRRIA